MDEVIKAKRQQQNAGSSLRAITIRGAREHNLKNVDVEIPRDKLVVFTGLSGSGKSSLAFDTIYAEGQRRYVESLSAYARQFLEMMQKPDVDQIDGLSPAISIEQKTTSKNPRSTVGTVTEIYDYLRLLYARVGHPHCPNCGRPITQQTVQQMAKTILALPDGTRMMILAPVIRDRKGEYASVFDEIRRQGFVRVRVDGDTVRDLTWEGAGCSISQASASMLAELVRLDPDGVPRTERMPRSEASALIDGFREALRSRGTIDLDEDTFGDAAALSGVSKYTARVKCAMLAWVAFEDALSRA
jgi:excinuclease UvrABC ATPase subunit